jgi:hypothetical protein
MRLQKREEYSGCNIHTATDFEKRREFNLPILLLFVDNDKAYKNLNREKLWQILREEDTPTQHLKAIQSP